MKIFKQIIKEFWIPLFLSIIWVIYNIYWNNSNETWNVQKTVNVFGPTFFLLSWLLGQFFRVKKQTKVEDSFEVIELRFKELLNKIEVRTEEMVNHISGGNSFPYLQIAMIDNLSNQGCLMIIHNGEYPLYDISARVVDLQKFEQIKDNFSLSTLEYTDTNLNIGNIIPSHATMLQNWKLESDPIQSYNIFFTARNGSFTQLLRFKKINGLWLSAIKVTNKDNVILYERIDDNYPREISGNISWE